MAQVPLPSQTGLATSLRVLQNGVPHDVPPLAKEAQAFMPGIEDSSSFLWVDVAA